jgi:hypothetical protein
VKALILAACCQVMTCILLDARLQENESQNIYEGNYFVIPWWSDKTGNLVSPEIAKLGISLENEGYIRVWRWADKNGEPVSEEMAKELNSILNTAEQ